MSSAGKTNPKLNNEEINDFFYKYNGYNIDDRLLRTMKAFWNKAIEAANTESPIDKEKVTNLKYKDQ